MYVLLTKTHLRRCPLIHCDILSHSALIGIEKTPQVNEAFVLTWQHTKPQYLLFFISPTFQMKKIEKRSHAVKETVSLCSATLCVHHSSCYQLAIWKNIFPVVAGTRQRGGWLSSGAATCLVLALIWHGGNGDLTALPQKSAPSDTRKRDLPPTPRLSQM